MVNINQAKEKIESSKIGQIIPIIKMIEGPINSLEYFAKLSNYGRRKNSILLESAETSSRYGQFSIATVDPCLRIIGKENKFEIRALNNVGRDIIEFVKKDLNFCKKLEKKKGFIAGIFDPLKRDVSEDQRLKLKTHMEILRRVVFKFKPTEKPLIPYCGLFGVFSYNLIDQFESLPNAQQDLTQNADYFFYFADNLFVFNHKTNELYLIANAFITDNKKDLILKRCLKIIQEYEKAISYKLPKIKKAKLKQQTIDTDTSRHEFESKVSKIKQNIIKGNIYRVFLSKTTISDYNAEPLDIFKKLKQLSPGPYMFYINDKDGILLGNSYNSIRVQGEEEKIIEIMPLTGIKPRGIINNEIEEDLDKRYEMELRLDPVLLIDHSISVDVGRNDIARISKPGTRKVVGLFNVDKYLHGQYLMSTVEGKLKDELDVLHLYTILMNDYCLTGVPKIMAMKLIREFERYKRGYYGGSVCYITPNNDFDGCSIASSLFLKNNKAHIRTGTNISYNSDPKLSFEDAENKAKVFLKIIRSCGGLK